MGEMQFCAMVLMSLLTVTLIVLLPHQIAINKVLNRSRWLMACGTALMAMQFCLQYFLKLREIGITQAVMANLLFFVPCASLFSLSILNSQHQGKIGSMPAKIGVIAWTIVVILLFGSVIISRQPILSDTIELRVGEYLSGIVYTAMQMYYTILLYRGNRRLSRALDNYYDHDTQDILRWIKRSVFMLSIVAVGAPFLIFSTGLPLLIYALTIFFSIYYLVFCFICYCVGNDAKQVSDASLDAEVTILEDDTSSHNSDEDNRRVERAVNNWIKQGGHLKSGITIQMAVNEMNIPRYLLTEWLKTTKWELFKPWLTHLRVEEAKRLLLKHPDWDNDTISQHCGFTSRSYFQQIFKKTTGMTPAQFIKQV